MAVLLVGLGILISAVQWVPSKELLDRSPRASGLTWEDLTYGSWHPELLPTLVVREAYGTRARDTDWMDGFYPYHEMNAYVGLIAIVLAWLGAGGSLFRDRWANFWVILVGIGGLLMLGKFTCLFDFANRLPILGSSREPVRFHLWVALATAALAALGVERLARPGAVPLRGGLILAGVLIVLSVPILDYVYAPVWSQSQRWTKPEHILRFRWLGHELLAATVRTGALAASAWWIAWRGVRSSDPSRRAALAALLPLLVMIDLFGAHIADVPTVDPSYWTKPPESARRVKADPDLIRVFGRADKSAGEPGYSSEPVDFMAVRDTLDWSLPLAWDVPSARGETPMLARRFLDYTDHAAVGRGRFDIEGVTHVVTGRRSKGKILNVPSEPAGAAFIHRNKGALPRARLAGRPVYAGNRLGAIAALDRLTLQNQLRDHLVVEDPTRPLPADATCRGTARIVEDLPERVVVEADAETAAYLVLADTFDPGWSATVDGRPAPIWPAYVAFRAVYLPPGKHTVLFTYRPAGFELGLALSGCGILLAIVCWFWPVRGAELAPDHAVLSWPPRWRRWWFIALGAIVLVSAVDISPRGIPTLHSRWKGSFHRFTWGSGIEAMKPKR
jgi:hypothetical protein